MISLPIPIQYGVTEPGYWAPKKRDALFFDHIALRHFDFSGISDPGVRADYEFLASREYLTSVPPLVGPDGDPLSGGKSWRDLPQGEHIEYAAAVFGLAGLFAFKRQDRPATVEELLSLTPAINVRSSVDLDLVAENAAKLLVQIHESSKGAVGWDEVKAFATHLLHIGVSRAIASIIDAQDQYSAVSIVPGFGQESLLLGRTEVSDVANLVLRSLPVPDELTPWEAILDFRRDEETRMQLSRLGRWSRDAVRRLVKSEVTHEELNDEHRSMIESYTEHMRVHRLKTSSSTMETLITFVAEVAENIVHLKFSGLAKTIFQLKHQRIALMEAELKAPGRELAYIVSAHERFGS